MKNNKKGFISITIIYSFFLLFMTIMLLIMYTYIHDRKMNNKIKSELVNSLHDKAPNIYVSVNGSNVPQPSYTVNVKIIDGGNGIASAKYVWSTSMLTTPTTDMTSYDMNITSPTQDGIYYLIIKACDVNNTCKTAITNYFLVGSSFLCMKSSTLLTENCNNSDTNGYCLSKGFLSDGVIMYGNFPSHNEYLLGDAYDCDVNGDGVYDPVNEKFYYISDYYNTSTKKFDKTKAVLVYGGNVNNGEISSTATTSYNTGSSPVPQTASDELTTTSQWTNTTLINAERTITPTTGDEVIPFTFDYSGEEKTFTVPYTGRYKIEAWGASGGTSDAGPRGGYGGYSVGEIDLTANDVLYINVGGHGVDSKDFVRCSGGGYNGGANASCNASAAAGGGATHIAKVSGLLSTLENNIEDILIVAGGGGGADQSGLGGDGGGHIGGSGSSNGGSQISGGQAVADAEPGSFGQGGQRSYDGGGGGGGFYGGAGAMHIKGGGGGSGYIGNTDLLFKTMYCFDCPSNIFSEGAYTLNTSCASSSPLAKCAKIGHGYVKITPLNIPSPYSSTQFTYTGKAARMLNLYEIRDCLIRTGTETVDGITYVHTTVIDECNFLFSRTKFANNNSAEGFYLETPYSNTNYIWTVDSKETGVTGGMSKTASNKYGTRPVIEVDKSRLQPSI